MNATTVLYSESAASHSGLSAALYPLPAEALTAANLARVPSADSSSSSRLTLSGETPHNTPPASDDGKTEVGTRPVSPFIFEKKAKDLEEGNLKVESRSEEEFAPEPSFPEGGLRAWTALAGATIVMAMCFGLSNSFGVFQSYYASHQLSDYQSSNISLIGSCHLFICFASSLFSGLFFDRGYFQYQLAFGSTLWVFGLFMLSLSSNYAEIFLAHAVCLGLGLGSMFGPCLACVGTYFLRKRSLTIGIAAAGTAIGAIVVPIMLENLFVSRGFGGAVRIVAYLTLGLLIIANLITRPRAKLQSRSATPPSLSLYAKILRQPTTWFVCLGCFGIMIGLFIPMFYIVIYTRHHSASVSPVLTKYALAIINAAAFVARIGAGLLADSIGTFNVAIPAAAILACSVFGLLAATTDAKTIVFLLIYGVAQGAFISVSAGCFMSLAESVGELGARSGTGFFFMALAALAGGPTAGALLTAANGNYVAPCCFGGAMATLGVASLYVGRVREAKRKGTRWI